MRQQEIEGFSRHDRGNWGTDPCNAKESLMPPTLVATCAGVEVAKRPLRIRRLPNATCGPVITDSSVEFPGVIRFVGSTSVLTVGVNWLDGTMHKRKISGELIARSLVQKADKKFRALPLLCLG